MTSKTITLNSKEFKKTMTGILDEIMAESSKTVQKEPLFQYLSGKKEWLGDPDEMHTMIIFPFREIIRNLVRLTLSTDDWLVQDIFVDWSFYEDNVSEFCSKLYGSACSADRGGWIIKSAINWKLKGELPIFEDHFWIPKSGTSQQWMNFVEGLGRLKLGKPVEYLKAYRELRESDNRYREDAITKMLKNEQKQGA